MAAPGLARRPTGPRDAYAGGAERWHADAALVYRPLARHLIAHAPIGLAGARVLDVGTGSGIAADELRAGGARVVGVDLEPDMVRFAALAGPVAVADAVRLPFGARAFDLSVAAFVVNHLPDPVAGLRELRRVTRPGGAALCAVFSQDRSRAKGAVDRVVLEHGYVLPDWYGELQRRAARVGSVDALGPACRAAGFGSVEVLCHPVDVGLDDPADIVRARLGMPQLRPFVESLPADRRGELIDAAVEAVSAVGEAFAPEVIEAVAR